MNPLKNTTRKIAFTFCRDEHSSSPLIEFEPLPDGLESDVLYLDRDTTMIFHDESLEMENQWAMEFCEALTLERH